jgi:hypothetical protein
MKSNQQENLSSSKNEPPSMKFTEKVRRKLSESSASLYIGSSIAGIARTLIGKQFFSDFC